MIAFQTGFFPNLAPNAGNDIFTGVELAAQTVVFAEVGIARPAIAMYKQHTLAVRGNYVTKRGQDGSVGHDRSAHRREILRVEIIFLLGVRVGPQVRRELCDRGPGLGIIGKDARFVWSSWRACAK